MPLTKKDLQDIKGVVGEAVEETVEPYFNAIQKDFNSVYQRLDKMDGRLESIEKFLLEDHRRRIGKLEQKVEKLEDLLAMK